MGAAIDETCCEGVRGVVPARLSRGWSGNEGERGRAGTAQQRLERGERGRAGTAQQRLGRCERGRAGAAQQRLEAQAEAPGGFAMGGTRSNPSGFTAAMSPKA